MGNSNTRDLTKGPVGRALFLVSAPMSIGILGVLSVGLADAAFLARAGETELAAIGFVYPAIVVLTSLAIGLGAGTAAVVSQVLGRDGDADRKSARLALHALIFAAGLASLASVAFHAAAPTLLALMGAEGAVRDEAVAYIGWWCLSFPPMVAGMGLNAVFRAGGEAQIAATVMSLQALLNIGLDPLFIFGWGQLQGMGTEGAGVATFLARGLAFAGLLAFAWRSGRVSIARDCLTGFAGTLRGITRIGAPAAASNAINPLGLSMVTAAVATIGDTAVAGFGAAARAQSLLFVPMLAMSSGIGPVVGQNWGAGRRDRAQRAVWLTFLACLVYGGTLVAVLWTLSEPVARLLANDTGAATYAAQYLRWVSLGFWAYGILVTANAAMNARDRALHSAGLSIVRVFGVYVPLAWAGVALFGYGGVLGAALAANLFAAIAGPWLCRRVGLLDIDAAGAPRAMPN
jgi:putative MATE family efflux protein